MKINWKSKKVIAIIAVGVMIFTLFIVSSSSASSKISKKEEEIVALQLKLKEQNTEIAKLNETVEKAKPWFDLSEKEQQRRIAEQKALEEAEAKKKAAEEAAKKAAEEAKAEKEAAALAAAEAEAQKKAEEEEKRGYDTGITYDQLARTPDDFIEEKVKFSGKVIQVMEGDGETQIRIAVNDDYDKVIYGSYVSYLVESRILEDDYITVMGTSDGLLTYESTMGGEITIPSIVIDKIEQK